MGRVGGLAGKWGSGEREGVPASDSGRGSSQGRLIGGWEVRVPTIAASASRPTLGAPSIEVYRFREPGVARPAPRESPRGPGKPYGLSQGVCWEFSVALFSTNLPMSSVSLVTLFPVVLHKVLVTISGLVEYEEGGKHFQIYKANDGNIEVALVYDEYEPSLAPPVGTVIMKLKGRTKVPVEEGPDQRSPGIERNTRVQSPECNQPQPLETTDEEDNYQEMRREEETGNLPKERTLPKIEPSNPKPTHACLHIGLDDNESRVDHQAGDDPLRDPGTLTPDDDEEDDDGPTTHMGLGRGIHQNLPGPFDIKFLPAPDIPSNGLLAARQLVPIAQYGETEEYEFYAKGVTLVLDDEDENPKYYRGNAFIRKKG